MNGTITYEEAKGISLSKNFTLDEFIYSETALRRGIDNSLPIGFLPRIEFLVTTVLQPIRDKFGPIKINSGYRSLALCVAVGSNAKSNHSRALAADIVPYDKSISKLDIMKFIEEELGFKELIAEFFPYGWIHVAAEKDNNLGTVKLKDNQHHYARMDVASIIKAYTA